MSRGFALGTRVTELHLNRGGRLHGGVTAKLADVILSRNMIKTSAAADPTEELLGTWTPRYAAWSRPRRQRQMRMRWLRW